MKPGAIRLGLCLYIENTSSIQMTLAQARAPSKPYLTAPQPTLLRSPADFSRRRAVRPSPQTLYPIIPRSAVLKSNSHQSHIL